MLIINGITFEVNYDTRGTAFFVQKENESLQIAMDILFQANWFEDENCSPSISVNFFFTNAIEIQELIGMSFVVNNIETADEREDTFYIFEHEPLVEYTLTILNSLNKKVQIKCVGIAVVDGYANPYITEPFTIECWLPVIEDKNDWNALGL